jgi:hypothetical protein
MVDGDEYSTCPIVISLEPDVPSSDQDPRLHEILTVLFLALPDATKGQIFELGVIHLVSRILF